MHVSLPFSPGNSKESMLYRKYTESIENLQMALSRHCVNIRSGKSHMASKERVMVSLGLLVIVLKADICRWEQI